MRLDFYLENNSFMSLIILSTTIYKSIDCVIMNLVNLFAVTKDSHLAIIAALCALIVLLIFIYSICIEKGKRKNKRREKELISESDKLQLEIIEKTAESDAKDKQIKELQKELDSMTEKPEQPKMQYEERIALLKQNDTCRKVLDKVNSEYIKSGQNYPKLTLTDTQKAYIFKAVDTAFPGFSMKIIKQYPRLTTSDVFYCCLYIIGLNEKQAAAITGKTYQAVWARSAKMNEIFGSDANLKIILKDFLSQWK